MGARAHQTQSAKASLFPSVSYAVMTRTETELIATLYLLYASECIVWLVPGERGFTRDSRRAWKEAEATPQSFTLRGRTPMRSSPLLWRPGFLRLAQDDQDDPERGIALNDAHDSALNSASHSALHRALHRALYRTARRLDGMFLLNAICRLQLFVLLVYVPVVVALHQLTRLWPVLGGLILLDHVVILALLTFQLRRYARGRLVATLAPLMINPVGAIRALDILTPLVFRSLLREPERVIH